MNNKYLLISEILNEKSIKSMYRNAGITPPRGNKRIHTSRAHKSVIWYMKKKGLSKEDAWKRTMGGMGKYAINPSHRRTTK